jgi:hypothetical protein
MKKKFDDDISFSLEFTESKVFFIDDLISEFEAVDDIICSIYLNKYDNKIVDKIGQIIISVYKPFVEGDGGLDFIECMDRSINTSYIMDIIDIKNKTIKNSILKKLDTYDEIGNIVVIENIVLDEKYRSMGLGEAIFKILISKFRGNQCSFMALKSFPLQFCLAAKEKSDFTINNLEKEESKAQKKLNLFYKKCGFTHIGKNLFIKYLYNI